ncbi:pickpocket protein 28-like [Homalodisca vitripennis]|uniref:pickpocket protein 28-like n=1 Tax=Homalodisca vitripennis TaxID=197043 RepID=UPI001EEA0EA0|nr:pickpocket protein 28-like [Homalodisca vitripennis]
MEENYLDVDFATPWCGCYPSCNEITYNFVTSNGLFFNNANSNGSASSESYAKISIYYSDSHFLGVHRQADTTFYDFLGTCGGLLGLFMGFSCVSAVEIFYHLIFRPLGCFLLCKRKINPPPTRLHVKNNASYIKSYYH